MQFLIPNKIFMPGLPKALTLVVYVYGYVFEYVGSQSKPCEAVGRPIKPLRPHHICFDVWHTINS